ncbi:MAG: sulfatase [Planctomycetota bacterium]
MLRPQRSRTLAAALLLLAAACSKETSDRWNVVVVTLDTTRADSLSCYGQRPGANTPHMDALAADGVRFAQAHSVCSVTPVSHASILTGQYQYKHGLRVIAGTGGFSLPADVPHLGEMLKRHGWTTVAVHSAFPVSSYFGFDRSFDLFDSLETSLIGNAAGLQGWDVDQFQRRSDETVDRAIGALERVGDDPFFLWLHLWDPHDMSKLPPDEYIEANRPDENWREKWPASKVWRRRYDVEVQYMDEQLGRLVEHLKANGSYERTLFVITSDHGEGLGEHEWLSHRLVYQEQLEVPLILRWPGGPTGRVVEGIASSVDVVPTVLAAMGIPFDAETIDGVNLLDAVGAGRAPDRITYGDQVNGYDTNAVMVLRRPKDDFLYMVNDGRWKLTWRPSFPADGELFDLANDPDEAHNLFGQALEPQRRLVRDLAARDSWVTAPIAPLEGVQQSAEALRALEKLGYVGADGTAQVVEPRWAWGCAEHLDVILEDPAQTCPRCDAPLLLRTAEAVVR